MLVKLMYKKEDKIMNHNDRPVLRTERNNSLFVVIAAIILIAVLIGFILRNKNEDNVVFTEQSGITSTATVPESTMPPASNVVTTPAEQPNATTPLNEGYVTPETQNPTQEMAPTDPVVNGTTGSTNPSITTEPVPDSTVPTAPTAE